MRKLPPKYVIEADARQWIVKRRTKSEKLGYVFAPIGYFTTLRGASKWLVERAIRDNFGDGDQILDAIDKARAEVVQTVERIEDEWNEKRNPGAVKTKTPTKKPRAKKPSASSAAVKSKPSGRGRRKAS